jgi:hypothetical protein
MPFENNGCHAMVRTPARALVYSLRSRDAPLLFLPSTNISFKQKKRFVDAIDCVVEHGIEYLACYVVLGNRSGGTVAICTAFRQLVAFSKDILQSYTTRLAGLREGLELRKR